MSPLAELLRKRRARPHWRDLRFDDLIHAVKMEVDTKPIPPPIDWEDLLLRFLRDGDPGLEDLDASEFPVEATKRAIAQALIERRTVPPGLLAWLGEQILHPTKAKRGAKPKHWRNHEIKRAVQMVAKNTNLPIDDAEHIGPTALSVVAKVFGMQQARVKDIFYETRKAYENGI